MIELDNRRGPGPATAVTATTRLFVAQLATRSRLLTLGAIGLIVALLGLVARSADDPLGLGAHIITNLGLAIVVPITTLVLASATIGEMRTEGTLVYLWLRPVPHWTTATAAAISTLIVAVPLAVLSLGLAAVASGEWSLVLPAAIAATLSVVGNAGLFVTLGAFADRAFLIGLGYVLIWEGLIARFGAGFAKLSVLSYATSFLEESADVNLSGISNQSMVAAIAVPSAVLVVGIALTARILARREIA